MVSDKLNATSEQGICSQFPLSSALYLILPHLSLHPVLCQLCTEVMSERVFLIVCNGNGTTADRWRDSG